MRIAAVAAAAVALMAAPAGAAVTLHAPAVRALTAYVQPGGIPVTTVCQLEEWAAGYNGLSVPTYEYGIIVSATLEIRAAACRTLNRLASPAWRKAHRQLRGEYARLIRPTGIVLHTFAHEGGHIWSYTHQGTGYLGRPAPDWYTTTEAETECFARENTYRMARLLSIGPALAGKLTRAAMGESDFIRAHYPDYMMEC